MYFENSSFFALSLMVSAAIFRISSSCERLARLSVKQEALILTI